MIGIESGPIVKEQERSSTKSTDEPEAAPPFVLSGADYCTFKGKKYAFNEKIEDGCESICKCMPSTASVECEPRCPKMNHTTAMHEQCVTVPDPKDLCCHIELCDVTLDDHEQGPIAIVPAPPSLVDAMKNKTQIPAGPVGHLSHDPDYDCEYNGSKYKIGNDLISLRGNISGG